MSPRQGDLSLVGGRGVKEEKLFFLSNKSGWAWRQSGQSDPKVSPPFIACIQRPARREGALPPERSKQSIPRERVLPGEVGWIQDEL